MRGPGEQILEACVRYTRDGLANVDGWAWLGWVAQQVNDSSDGRRIAKPVRKLVDAGLLERKEVGRGGSKRVFLRPTARGHKVDKILGDTSVDRGGKFRPLKDAGLTDYRELSAIR